MEQPRANRSLWPLLVGALVVLVVGVGGAATLVATSGNDVGNPQAEETAQPGDDLDFAAIDERYRSLGRAVTTGASECEGTEVATGETEVVVCTTPEGTLTLTTYDDAAGVEAARTATLDHAAGTIVSEVESGAFYSLQPTADSGSAARALLYWDSAPGLQSALYTAGAGVDAEDLRRAFDATAPMVTPPAGPADAGVEDLVTRFDLARCRRIPTRTAGETEESRCVRTGRRAWVARFASADDFLAHRDQVLSRARADRFPVQDFWYVDENGDDQQDAATEEERGKVYGYLDEQDDGLAVLYLDDAGCQCFLQIRGEQPDDPKILYELLFPSPQPRG